MSFFNSLRAAPQSPRDEAPFPSFGNPNPLSPQRNQNRLSGGIMNSANNATQTRAGLQRRFTTNELPTLSPIGQQRRQAAGETMPSTAYGRIAPSEIKARQYEQLLAQQRRIQEQLDAIDPDTRREVDQGRLHEAAVSQMIAQSEPTTPPDYSEGFSSFNTRPNRYSSASMMSPPSAYARTNRSSMQWASPPATHNRPYSLSNVSQLPSQSVPGSRRQSDDEEDEDDFMIKYDTSIHRAAANPNRNSMPVSSYDRKRGDGPDLSSILGPVNTTSFLFGADNERPTTSKSTTTSPDSKTYLQLKHTADGFPKLIRREDNMEVPFTVASQALDLASRSPDSERQVTDAINRRSHRISLPPSALAHSGMSQLDSVLAGAESKPAAGNRRSMEVRFAAETNRPGLTSPPRGSANGMPKPHPSYSTNDIPTLKSINGANGVHSPPNRATNPSGKTSPQQNSDSSNSTKQGTIFSNDSRQLQDFSGATSVSEGNNGFVPGQSGLQASAAPFSFSEEGPHQGMMSPYAQNPYQQPYYNPFTVPMLNNGFNNMNMNGGGYGGQGQWPGPMGMYQQNGYGGYQQGQQQQQQQRGQATGGAGRFSDSQRNVMQQRRAQNDDSSSRFANISMSDLNGQIYELCKDQHGCRFLQKKLEERDEKNIQQIFEEVKDHVHELMMDPFGNYLCQKLLENANDQQRTVLIRNAMPAMTVIATNQHGTRALQKMIEFITTPQQTTMIIEALQYNVVPLIQDLNGNHVIQKCLNHLASPDAEFIFKATAKHCIEVGTHRHGCCVLQRCIDHASGDQKAFLIQAITRDAYTLVQDPFGNYVVQYILDLDEPEFTEPLCKSFAGNVAFLSKQKFSSNVIEKCIRCAKDETKRALISEIVPPFEIEKMLRDSFANYVVQTAIDFADPDVKAALIESIRPIIPSIRHSPYGRRIQSKIQEFDGQNAGSGPTSGAMTPVTGPSPAQYSNHQTPTGRANRQGFVGSPPNWGGVNGGGAYGSGSMGFGSLYNGEQDPVMAPGAQRNNPTYAMLNGGYPNYQNHGFNGAVFSPAGRQAQAGYGQL